MCFFLVAGMSRLVVLYLLTVAIVYLDMVICKVKPLIYMRWFSKKPNTDMFLIEEPGNDSLTRFQLLESYI